jgi:hypothetical protein
METDLEKVGELSPTKERDDQAKAAGQGREET